MYCPVFLIWYLIKKESWTTPLKFLWETAEFLIWSPFVLESRKWKSIMISSFLMGNSFRSWFGTQDFRRLPINLRNHLYSSSLNWPMKCTLVGLVPISFAFPPLQSSRFCRVIATLYMFHKGISDWRWFECVSWCNGWLSHLLYEAHVSCQSQL